MVREGLDDTATKESDNGMKETVITCPTCNGRKIMPKAYYSESTFPLSQDEIVDCHTCDGKGTYTVYEKGESK